MNWGMIPRFVKHILSVSRHSVVGLWSGTHTTFSYSLADAINGSNESIYVEPRECHFHKMYVFVYLLLLCYLCENKRG
jgi:hypothetical protein